MKLLKQIVMLITVMLLVIACAIAQDTEQRPSRQVWIRLKSGPILTGDLVKMDPDSVDFKVKGVLQSVKCDDVLGVMFIPPSQRPTPAPEPTQEVTPQQQQQTPQPQPAPPPPRQEVESQPKFPDHCGHRSVQLNGGQYKHDHFGNKLRDFHYTGEFHVDGGNASVYIIDTENFTKLVNHNKFEAFYAATKVTEGKFDIPCQKGQDYHLVWWNESLSDTRMIEAELCFTQLGQ